MVISYVDRVTQNTATELHKKKQNSQHLETGHISLSRFLCGSSILVELKFEDIVFCGGRKTGVPGDNPSELVENQQQTQPTNDIGPKSTPCHIGGRRELLTLHHPCFPTKSSLTHKRIHEACHDPRCVDARARDLRKTCNNTCSTELHSMGNIYTRV